MNKTPAYKLIFCLVLCLAVLALAACGGGAGSGDGAGSGESGVSGAEAQAGSDAPAGSDASAGSHVAGGVPEGQNYGVKAEVTIPLDDPEYEELFISALKSVEPEGYPGITLGEAYDNYFGSPEWSVVEGASSYYDDTIEYVVEFRGTCVYEGEEARALIQFTYDSDYGGFEATWFELDGEPMEFRDLNAVTEIAFYQLSGE